MMNYAIVGGGRLARHFSEYFRLLEIPHSRWTRDHRSPFNTFEGAGPRTASANRRLANADRVLLLVSDKAIAALAEAVSVSASKSQLIHCSGSLSVPGVAGAHPLMTFADHLYGLDTYQKVPFVLETGSDFARLFPGLPNPNFVMNVEDKARYHAMCVMAGNFPQLLWKGISDRFEQQFELPAAILHPYLKQLAENFIQAPESALTGPLARNDQPTIERNLNSLDGDPLQDLYARFYPFLSTGSKAGAAIGTGSNGAGDMNVLDFQACKARHEKIVMLTCYDYTSACIVQDSDIDVILVGDSAAMVMHGYGTTIPADIEMMCRHIESVSRGTKNKFIVGDMPFLSFRQSLHG